MKLEIKNRNKIEKGIEVCSTYMEEERKVSWKKEYLKP